MTLKRWTKGAALLLALGLTAAACGSDDEGDAASGELTKVKLQLQWFNQAQFAGYYAAIDQGFYEKQGLDVEILEGGVDIVPATQLASGAADFAISWVPRGLAARESGAGITNISQVFQRSGTLQVSWKDSNITKPEDLKGKKVGNWGFGNEFELFAGMTKAGLAPGKDVTLVQQQFDMQALLKGDIGTAMFQDAIWANTAKLKDAAYQDQTVKFIAASIKGWAFCRDNAERCRDIVVSKGSKLGASHQLWQTNEINKLIWPAPSGAGVIDKAAWDQTVKIAQEAKNAEGRTVLTKAPEGEAYTNDYVNKAIEQLKAEGVDVTGSSFEPITVELKEGGA
jgi:NitT/TauT family transport system substrate-binding protein